MFLYFYFIFDYLSYMKSSSDTTCDHEDNNNGMKNIDIYHIHSF